ALFCRPLSFVMRHASHPCPSGGNCLDRRLSSHGHPPRRSADLGHSISSGIDLQRLWPSDIGEFSRPVPFLQTDPQMQSPAVFSACKARPPAARRAERRSPSEVSASLATSRYLSRRASRVCGNLWQFAERILAG